MKVALALALIVIALLIWCVFIRRRLRAKQSSMRVAVEETKGMDACLMETDDWTSYDI